MKLYNKYIILKLLGPIIFVGGSLTGLIWLTQALRFIDLIINQGIGIFTFIYVSIFLLPSLIGIILPVSVFISVVYVYNKLMMESELVILENSGLSRFQIAKPVLIVALLAVLFGYFISLYLMPASFREFKDMQSFIRNNYASLLLQDGVFNNPAKGLTIYVRERDKEGFLHGILVHDNRNPEKPVTMMAETGSLVQTESGPRFLLNKGSRQEIDYKSDNIAMLYFDSYTIDISLYTETTEVRWREPQERFLPELLNPEKSSPENLNKKLFAEAHNRISWPIYSFVLSLMALTIFLTGELNRRGRWQKILVASLAAFGVMAIAVVINNMVAKNNTLMPVIYLNLLIISLICIYILTPKIKSK